MSLKADLRKAARLDTRAWLDCVRACAELAIARVLLARRRAHQLLEQSRQSPAAVAPLSPRQSALIERIAFAIPRMGARVPWRSSCLVQALAARRWLAGQGVASELHLGARKPAGGDMEAHAWLTAGGQTVVGGEAGDYQPFRPARRT